jgi:hypothetical protein
MRNEDRLVRYGYTLVQDALQNVVAMMLELIKDLNRSHMKSTYW